MADDTQKKAGHPNIHAAFSAFQGEKMEVKKTKRFGKPEEKMTFMYAPLDEFLDVVKPIASKHGLSITWEQAKDMKNGIVAAMYHETYASTREVDLEETTTMEGAATKAVTKYVTVETGVMRSMPIEVKRSGDMKVVGADSTYARRYTLGELLGIAAEEDTDVGMLEQRVGTMGNALYQTAQKSIDRETTDEGLKKQIDFLDGQLKLIAGGKPSSIGLDKAQIDELVKHAGKRRNELRKGVPGANGAAADEVPAVPGENDDAGEGQPA